MARAGHVAQSTQIRAAATARQALTRRLRATKVKEVLHAAKSDFQDVLVRGLRASIVPVWRRNHARH